MNDNNAGERNRLYDETRKDLLNRELSNSQIYDRSILTLSTSALGISLAFIKDIVPLEEAHCSVLLTVSWWLFGLAIILTMTSFLVSQWAIKKQLVYAEKYYLEGIEKYQKKKNKYATITDCLNISSGLIFISAIVLTIAFVQINVI